MAAGVDIILISLFGLQHSVMARPWFKTRVLHQMPEAFERCAFVHAANIALFSMIALWQPIPNVLWEFSGPVRSILWGAFAAGWIILLLGALSFGIFDLLGVSRMRAWYLRRPTPQQRLKTGMLYKVVPHPMYVGVLLAMWATPRMTAGHLMLALGMTLYVLIAMRYEERDLAARFGTPYNKWRNRLRSQISHRGGSRMLNR